MMRFILILAGLIFLACNGNDAKKETTETQAVDTIKVSGLKKTGDNSFLIEPPDTAYSGDYVDKYENGNTKFKGFFRFGKRHGQWMAWYANGLMWSECFYDKGLKHGANNVYYENGKLRYSGFFKDDKRDSIWVFYDVNGVEVQRLKFKNDEEVPLGK